MMHERSTRVLLVEDNPGLRDTMSDIIWQAGMEIDTAYDMPSALGLLTHGRYDVAIVDLVLPGPSGVEVIRKLKSISPTTRIIVWTAYHNGELLVAAKELGIDRAVSKPADPEALIALIKSLAGKAAD
jgi:DNA-binding response OmpR family regulator